MRHRTLPLEVMKQLDALCDRFETHWTLKSHQSVEELLLEAPQEHILVFLEALLQLEMDLRHRQNEVPDLIEYLQRFPKNSSLVNRVYRQQFSELLASHLRVNREDSFNESGQSFGDFETIELLGEGGMGTVFLAWDRILERQVAIKVIRAETLQSQQRIDQFVLEAKAMAALHHPNIVSIFSAGRIDSGPFLVMEYVAGGSLSKHISASLPSERESVRLMIEVSKAIEYAHLQGIVHRDLNPQNILLTEARNPKVADFGLAKWEFDEQKSIDEQRVVGTPSYMSPEQTEGRGTVGPRADVYGLGAIFYELLTGRPPFRGSSPLLTMDQVRHHEAVSPIALQPSLSRDLDTICLKCLRKDPKDRYQSVKALREDLERYEQGRPILARPVNAPTKAYRWMKRNPVVSTWVGVTVIATLLGLGGTMWQLRRAEVNLESAVQERELHERNFSRAHEAIDYLSKMTVKLPHSLSVRQELLQTTEEYYRELANERKDDTKLSHGLGLTLLRLGQVRGDMGLYDGAIEAYREGLMIERALLEVDPADNVSRRHIAGISQNLAGLLRFYGPEFRNEAIGLQQDSVEAWKEICADSTASYESRIEYAKSLFSFSMLLLEFDDIERSKLQNEETLVVLAGLRESVPERHEAYLIEARALSHQGTFFEQVDDWQTSKALHERALESCRIAMNLMPNLKEAQIEFSDLQNNIAIVHKRLGEVSSAQESYSQAIATVESLLAAEPDDANLIQKLSRTRLNSGILHFDNEKFAEAEDAFQHAVELHRRLLDLAPNSVDVQKKLQTRINRLIATRFAMKDIEGVREAVDLRVSLFAGDADLLWLSALEMVECVRSLPSEPLADGADGRLRAKLVERTIEILNLVTAIAPERAAALSEAPEFEIIHGEPGFHRLLESFHQPAAIQ